MRWRGVETLADTPSSLEIPRAEEEKVEEDDKVGHEKDEDDDDEEKEEWVLLAEALVAQAV